MMMGQNINTNGHLKSFQGAVVIITGGASGMGAALARQVARKGARAVVLLDRQVELAEQVATKIRSTYEYTTSRVFEVDVRNFEQVQNAVTETRQEFGRLDYMFCNAGTAVGGSLEELGVEDFNYVLDVNIRGVANGVHAAYPIMKNQGFGHIVNTGSIFGLTPGREGFAAYGTSKYAVIGLSLNLRVEAARHGVRVSVLCPGVIDTPLLKEGGIYGKNKSRVTQEAMDKEFAKYHPMNPDRFAVKALKLVTKNKPIIVVPAHPWKFLWLLFRLSPSIGLRLITRENNKFYKKMEEELAKSENERGGDGNEAQEGAVDASEGDGGPGAVAV